MNDKVRKYVFPNIPYLFVLWFSLKLGTAYRLAAGAGFGEKLIGMMKTIGPAFQTIAPGLVAPDGGRRRTSSRLSTLFLKTTSFSRRRNGSP